MEEKGGHLIQMEFIAQVPLDIIVELKGNNLMGELDFMTARDINLVTVDEQLRNVVRVKTSLITADTSGSSVEANCTLMIMIYNYGQNLDIAKVYGLFVYATIYNFMAITNTIASKEIKHNDSYYRPTVTIPSFQQMEKEIISEMKRAYNLY